MSGPEAPGHPAPNPPAPPREVTARTTEAIRADAVRGTWWTAVNALAGMPLAVVANLVVARTLGPHGFGLVASYMIAYALIITVLNAGISDATVQFGAAAFARGDRDELLAIARRCAGFHLLVEGPAGAVAVVLLLHRETWTLRIVAGIAVGLTMAIGTASVVLTAMAKNAPLAKLNLVVGVALQAGVVTAAITSHSAGPVWVARLVIAIALPVGALVMADPVVRRATLTPTLPRDWPPGFVSYAIRTLAAGLVTSLVFSRTELLVLDAYGAVAAAGVFALAAGLAAQLTAPIDAMLGPLLPSAAALLAVDRTRAAAAVLRGLRLSVFATSVLVMLTVPAVSLLAPLVYGDRFAAVGAYFVALALMSCLQSVLHPVSAFVTALRLPMTVLGINAVGLAVDLAVVLALVPGFGAVAAVLGNCLGQAVSLGGSVLLLRSHLGVGGRPTARILAPFVLVSAVVAVVSALCLHWHQGGGNLGWVLAVSLGVSVTASLAALRYAPGRLTEADLAMVTRTFPRLGPSARVLARIGFATAER